MRLAEILGLPVTCDGAVLGHVVDARFVLRGPSRPGALATPELVGLIVGPRRGAAFLGYERVELSRPALLNRFLAWRQRGSFLVDVSELTLADGAVELTPGFTRWSTRLARG